MDNMKPNQEKEGKMVTYTKLKSGEWGIRAEGALKAGMTVVVSKKSGESRRETIGKVVFSGNGVSLATIDRRSGTDAYGNRVSNGESYAAGVLAPHGRRCPICGSRECAKAWNPKDLCDED
jgi:hypothetical protein